MRGKKSHSNSSENCILGNLNVAPLLFTILQNVSGNFKGCWQYTGSKNPKGYGRRELKGKSHMVHRLVHFLVGNMSKAEYLNKQVFVMHVCDNTGCINPVHLVTGNSQKNTADRVAKGRCAKGERQHAAKLTASMVSQIREKEAHTPVRQLANKYNVHYTTMSRMLKKQTWRHL